MIDQETKSISPLENDAERCYLVDNPPAIHRLLNQVFDPFKNGLLEWLDFISQEGKRELTSPRILAARFISSTIIPILADNQSQASQKGNFEEHILWTDVIKGMTDACGLVGIVEEEAKGSTNETFNRAIRDMKSEYMIEDDEQSTSTTADVYLTIVMIAKEGMKLLVDDESGAKVIEWFIEEMKQGRISQKEWFKNQPLIVVDFYLAGMDFAKSLFRQIYPQAKGQIEERTI